MSANPLYDITYGLYVVGTFADGRPAGCIINTCFQVTSENPTLAISLNKNNYTLECLRRNPRFSLSIVAEDTDPMIISSFGFRSSRDADKYADFGFDTLDDAPAVRGRFCGRLILDAVDFIDCSTHVLVLGRLVATYPGEGTPMTYAYYHRVIKGKTPKNAPTYRTNEADESENTAPGTTAAVQTDVAASGKHRYRCDVCGYEVETDGPLPDDYVCPICGVDRSHFVEI